MRFREIVLSEGRILKYPVGSTEVPVFVNPSREQFAALMAKHGILRAFLGEHIYVWDATAAVHADIGRYLPDEAYGDMKLVLHPDEVEISQRDDPDPDEIDDEDAIGHYNLIVRCYGRPMPVRPTAF